jgi:hypothetical protein
MEYLYFEDVHTFTYPPPLHPARSTRDRGSYETYERQTVRFGIGSTEVPGPLRYDLFAERLGFKLVWGCLCFYPHFYCVGVWAIVGASPANDLSPALAAAVGALFAIGWALTRGANLQARRPPLPTASSAQLCWLLSAAHPRI